VWQSRTNKKDDLKQHNLQTKWKIIKSGSPHWPHAEWRDDVLKSFFIEGGISGKKKQHRSRSLDAVL